MEFRTLVYDVEDRVATITLDRPERRNAFDWTMAEELARKIATHSPTALARSEQATRQILDTELDDALKRTWEMIRDHARHPDHSEGPRAKLEKRAPSWAPYLGS